MIVNGRTEIAALAAGESLTELLERHGIDASVQGLAIAVNQAVVRRNAWAQTRVAAGDTIEIVRPFQGG